MSGSSRKTTAKNEAQEESESLVVFREYDRRSSKKPKLVRGRSNSDKSQEHLEEEKTIREHVNTSNFDDNGNVGTEGAIPQVTTLKSQVQRGQPSAKRAKFRS